uniref:VWFC domain-containing protein n=1 Tax=Strigamia maritima TaxID=126957 RepID=T1IM06_STRMM
MLVGSVVPRLMLMMTIQAMVKSNCTNFKKEIVTSGQRFIPLGYDPCTTCTCQNGQVEMCTAILCSPPKDCLNSQLADDKCCEFMCKNGVDLDLPPLSNVTTIGTKENDGLNTANLGLRLVASTVTSFLVLALLLFMIHRLRQRRLLLMIRRINNNHLSRGPCREHRYPDVDDINVGYYRDRDHVDFGFFEDPPPPYTFWKPPESYFPQGEAPPPYEAVTNYPVPPLTPHVCTPAAGLPLRLPSLSSVSLHANNFQMNDLGQETVRSEDSNPSLPLHHMNLVGSTSSLSSQSELNLNEDLVLRADAKYEDAGDLTEHRVSNLAVFNEFLRDGRDAGTPKRRSFSDVLDSWHRCDDQSSDFKRRSLQVPMTAEGRQRGHYSPGPGAWLGDGSESSSSSSPTYDGQTDSLTSSDSSSFDYNFLRAKVGDRGKAAQVGAESGPSGPKENSLDRTLSQLKERIGRRKKPGHKFKRKAPTNSEVLPTDTNVAAEMTIPVHSAPIPIAGLPENPSGDPANGDVAAGSCVSTDRPNSGSLGSTTCSSRASFGSSLSSPASPARYETPSTSSSCSSSTANYYLNVLHQPAAARRSASVCSETGERKHRSRLSLPRDVGDPRVEPRRTRAHTSPSGSNVRISLDLWQQNHESYI